MSKNSIYRCALSTLTNEELGETWATKEYNSRYSLAPCTCALFDDKQGVSFWLCLLDWGLITIGGCEMRPESGGDED